jgi:hypothetical protein
MVASADTKGDAKVSHFDYLEAKLTVNKQSDIIGVRDIKTVSVDGEYTFCLTLHSGENVTLSGLALPKITSNFPIYDLTEVERDVCEKCFSLGGNELVKRLPQPPRHHVGGDKLVPRVLHFAGIKISKIFSR